PFGDLSLDESPIALEQTPIPFGEQEGSPSRSRVGSASASGLHPRIGRAAIVSPCLSGRKAVGASAAALRNVAASGGRGHNAAAPQSESGLRWRPPPVHREDPT